MMDKLCKIAINQPVGDSILTYGLPMELSGLKPGTIVEVPLGKRQVKGCLVTANQDEIEAPQGFEIKKISKEIAEEVSLDEKQMEFFQWISKYYHYPLGPLIFESLPKALKKPREINFIQGEGSALSFKHSPAQEEALHKTLPAIGAGFSKWLIHGVTGSGKSVVFLELIKRALEQNKSVLYLLPEINLTIQFIDFFKEHLNCEIYSYNSAISNSDKYQLWKKVQGSGKPILIIGVRSSIFLPVDNLGLIIIDEEHDQSFKQDDRCPYNARDIAIKKANLCQIPIVLGSATPSLETFHAFKNRSPENYIMMPERIGESKLPQIEMVDIRDKKTYDEEIWPLKPSSVEAIRSSLERDKQVLIFVNKLGYAGFMQCRACGKSFDCPNCSTSLRVYKKRHSLECHVCDYKDSIPESCDLCGNMNLIQKGFGTEKLKDVLTHLFSEKRVERFDRDEVTTMKKVEERLGQFHDGSIDILVGTQMLSKGHNFEKVDLVVILGIDSQLNFPDFKSHERVYQQLTQVSGRSGRFGGDSRVLIQTLNPEIELFKQVLDHSFDEFYATELEMREQCSSPPFSKLAMIYVTGKNQNHVIKESQQLVSSLKHLIENHFQDVLVLGPRPALMEKRVNKFTWALMLKSQNINSLHNLISTMEKEHRTTHSVSLKIDIDPYFLN